jgi:predicted Fe-Mo cluster-binding NifX family protein
LLKKIAFASSDGIFINQHFGYADMFYIYEFNESKKNFLFIEKRRFIRDFYNNLGHNIDNLEKVYNLLKDCNGIFINKIGISVSKYLIQKGFRIFEINAKIKDVLEAVIEQNK